MGTHCYIKVVQLRQSGAKLKKYLYVFMYIHYDGYLSGVGKQLANFLRGITCRDDDADQTAFRYVNEARELAALIVHHFKNLHPSGNVSLEPLATGWEEAQEEYTYEVMVDCGDIRVRVCKYDEILLESGTVKQFLELCSKEEEDDD